MAKPYLSKTNFKKALRLDMNDAHSMMKQASSRINSALLEDELPIQAVANFESAYSLFELSIRELREWWKNS